VTCYKYETSHYLRTRHVGACDGEMCSGCEPCTEAHCRCKTHLQPGENSCAKCVGDAREHLRNIGGSILELTVETPHQGIRSEAAKLTGPAADPEAWMWRRVTKARQGGLLNDAHANEDDRHPHTILGDWEFMIRDLLNQPTDLRWTLGRCIDYLTDRLTTLARNQDFDFEQFADEIRTLHSHLETVRHNQPQGDPAGVGCFDCGGGLERKLTANSGFEDVWTCRGCRRRYTYAEYNFALRAALEGQTA
jgi:hypothetical protein